MDVRLQCPHLPGQVALTHFLFEMWITQMLLVAVPVLSLLMQVQANTHLDNEVYTGCGFEAVPGQPQALKFCNAYGLCIKTHCGPERTFSQQHCGCIQSLLPDSPASNVPMLPTQNGSVDSWPEAPPRAVVVAAAESFNPTASPSVGNMTSTALYVTNMTSSLPSFGNMTSAPPSFGNMTSASPSIGIMTSVKPDVTNRTSAISSDLKVTSPSLYFGNMTSRSSSSGSVTSPSVGNVTSPYIGNVTAPSVGNMTSQSPFVGIETSEPTSYGSTNSSFRTSTTSTTKLNSLPTKRPAAVNSTNTYLNHEPSRNQQPTVSTTKRTLFSLEGASALTLSSWTAQKMNTTVSRAASQNNATSGVAVTTASQNSTTSSVAVKSASQNNTTSNVAVQKTQITLPLATSPVQEQPSDTVVSTSPANIHTDGNNRSMHQAKPNGSERTVGSRRVKDEDNNTELPKVSNTVTNVSNSTATMNYKILMNVTTSLTSLDANTTSLTSLDTNTTSLTSLDTNTTSLTSLDTNTTSLTSLDANTASLTSLDTNTTSLTSLDTNTTSLTSLDTNTTSLTSLDTNTTSLTSLDTNTTSLTSLDANTASDLQPAATPNSRLCCQHSSTLAEVTSRPDTTVPVTSTISPQPSTSNLATTSTETSPATSTTSSTSVLSKTQTSTSVLPKTQTSTSVLSKTQTSTSVLSKTQTSTYVLSKTQTSTSVLPKTQTSTLLVSGSWGNWQTTKIPLVNLSTPSSTTSRLVTSFTPQTSAPSQNATKTTTDNSTSNTLYMVKELGCGAEINITGISPENVFQGDGVFGFLYIGSRGITSNNGSIHFNGHGSFWIPFYEGNRFTSGITIVMTLKENTSLQARQGIVSNCGNDRSPSFSISLDPSTKLIKFKAVVMPTNIPYPFQETVEVSVPYTPGTTKTLEMQCNGRRLIGRVDGHESGTHLPSTENYELSPRSKPLYVGVGCRQDEAENFHGDISSFAVYRCVRTET